jgi:hypothetical protein
MNKRKLLLVAVLLMAAVGVFAQTATDSHTVTITIAPIAAIALSSTADITFTTAAPALAGDDPGPTAGAPATNATKRLWYTAANLTGMTRHITVGSDVNPPAGTSLTVNAAVEAQAGAGANAGPASVSTVTVALVTGIGSIATGRTGTDGAGLTYSFWVSAPGSLVVGAAPTVVTVTYTLTDDSF